VDTPFGETDRGGSQTQTSDEDFLPLAEDPELTATPGRTALDDALDHLDEDDDQDEPDEPSTRWERNSALRYEYLDLTTKVESAQAEGDNETVRSLADRQQQIMDTFWEENKGLALKVVRRFRRLRESSEDYVQDAVEGLVVAFHRWDPERSTFATFCQQYIKGKVNRGFNALEYGDRSYGDHTAAPRVTESKNALTLSLGRRPTFEEIAEHSGLTAGVVERVLAGKARSLDTPLFEDGTTLGDQLAQSVADPGSEFPDLDAAALSTLLSGLTARQKYTVINVAGLHDAGILTLAALAAEVGEGRESLRRDFDKAKEGIAKAQQATQVAM
jgi:DNA-directed RNA polymerase specialized sigma subunit